jgi:hypothetical protein
MEDLNFLHLGVSALRTEAEINRDYPHGDWERDEQGKNRTENARPEKEQPEFRLAFDEAEEPLEGGENSASGAETGIGRNRWLSGILDAAGKVAGAVAPQAKIPVEPEPEQPAPAPLNAQGFNPAGSEQLSLAAQVLESLDTAVWAAKTALNEENCLNVSQACLRLASIAASHNLENLDRIARCVDRAAQANDLEAVQDLLSELESSVERNRKHMLATLEDREYFKS